MFNGAGKTDILVRKDNRNVFIAEAKIWRGQAGVGKALDQLLGYMVWRDSKAALVVFIRNDRRPATRIEALHSAVTDHPRVVSGGPVSTSLEGEGRYVLSADDEGRTISLAVLPVVLSREVDNPNSAD